MMARRKKAPPAALARDAAIHEAIAHAIMEGRLKAGSRMPEHRLADLFGVSRERIRKILHRLAAERRLELVPNRGARVPSPSLDDIHRVYEAHRLLEAGVLTQLVEMVDETLLKRLDDHLAAERAAAERNDRATSVSLSGAFHVHLVDALNNPELSRFLRELLSRSSVMVSVYEPASQSICAVDEHGAIVEALRAKDVTRAIHLSRHHFHHVEQRLRLEPVPDDVAVDLDSVFEAMAKPKPRGKARTKRGASR